jgi:mRNA interferase HigB
MRRTAATDLHRDIHPRAKKVNDSHETVYREPAKICIPQAREISRSYTRQAMRLTYTQTISIERFDNFRGQDRLELADVKREFGTASILRDGRVVFNIAGNKYRLVVWINYSYRVVYVRFIGTHKQYDRIDAQTI